MTTLPAPRTATPTVASLVERVWTRPEGASHHGLVGLRLDAARRPVALLVGPDGDHLHEAPVSLRVSPTDSLQEVAQLLLSRPVATRFDPLVCVDDDGAALGVVRVERIIQLLASQPSY